MGLPKLNTPTYELVLPSTEETIKYRPFLVKEQKILMMAQESEEDSQMYQVMSDIVKSCTFDEIDTEVSPIFDIEYIFLKLRSKSVGEKTTVRLLCPDDKKTYANIEIDLTKNDIPENFSLVDILIDDKRIMIESDSLRAVRKVIRKFMESGYIISRDFKLEKTFKEDKVTRYMRVFKIIHHGSCFSYN